VKGIFAAPNAKLGLLGSPGNLKWENTDEGLKIFIPEKIRKNLPCDLAWAVKISSIL
jgi:alpha-L-fucosidase